MSLTTKRTPRRINQLSEDLIFWIKRFTYISFHKLALSLHSKTFLGLIPSLGLFWKELSVWVYSRYSGSSLLAKGMYIRLIGVSKLLLGVSVFMHSDGMEICVGCTSASHPSSFGTNNTFPAIRYPGATGEDICHIFSLQYPETMTHSLGFPWVMYADL